MESISLAQARRIAITAQGFGDPRPAGAPDRRHLRRVLKRVNVFQIDSVNVLVRSHYLPLFSRLGSYDTMLVERAAYTDHELFEYWGHAACLIPVDLHPLFRWKMAQGRIYDQAEGHQFRFLRERPDYVEAVLEEVAARGPLTAGELEEPGEKRGPWWGWADGKHALEVLFLMGKVAATRRPNFERVYDIPSRVIPPHILNAPAPSELEARMELLRLASQSLGVATASDLCEYWFLRPTRTKAALDALVDAGDLLPVAVEGWNKPAYLAPGARAGRRSTTTVLSMFDSLVWNRDRIERLFDFVYRIEIYTPAPKRVYGYYVLPVLHGDRLVGRLDVKAERQQSTLAVRASHAEPGIDPSSYVEPLAANLRALARWLRLERVRIDDRGDLAPALWKVADSLR